MSPETTVRYFEFDAAKAGPWVPAAAALLVQSSTDVDVEAVTLIGQTPEALGTVSAGSSTTYSTSHAFVRLVSAGEGTASIAASMPVSSGTGGGGSGGGAATIADGADVAQGARSQTAATDDTGTWSLVQLTKRGLQRIATILDRLPPLVSGRMPVDGSGVTQPVSAGALPLPTGAATETTLAAASGKLPASLGSKTASASLSVTTATGSVTSVGGTVTTGGAAQQLAAANTGRRGLTLQNTSTGELRVNPFGTANATAGYRVSAGDLLVLDSPHCGVGAVSVWGATTGQTFVGGEAV